MMKKTDLKIEESIIEDIAKFEDQSHDRDRDRKIKDLDDLDHNNKKKQKELRNDIYENILEWLKSATNKKMIWGYLFLLLFIIFPLSQESIIVEIPYIDKKGFKFSSYLKYILQALSLLLSFIFGSILTDWIKKKID